MNPFDAGSSEYDGEGGEYKKHSASHFASTGDWLFLSDAYQKWHSSSNQGLLWIRGDLDSISSADLWLHLQQATISMPRVYCVVDALDEMDRTKDLEPFLQSVAEFASWRSAKAKVAVTSRPVTYIEIPLRTARVFHLRLEESEVDVDIATFV
ncbi:hypothetical protein B0H67DRAFT_641164 [Lasiosphaeris hirsuta]|uniref:Nephrocystin 3-like N-terminal domain-containing protein n=1 Tax=Lasiosphaeris hirsuta TaxID=260670 RepID=A0AA40AZ46_9PEZI|nr:hypothetical protein B0H67DRAFT_641164 [Lasiosphaeris hirsuta]